MMLLVGALVGLAIGMIVTVAIITNEVEKEREGKKLVNYDSMMEQLEEYYADCRNDVNGDHNCVLCNDTCFDSVFRIINGEVED